MDECWIRLPGGLAGDRGGPHFCFIERLRGTEGLGSAMAEGVFGRSDVEIDLLVRGMRSGIAVVGFGAAGIGEAGETVNTFIDPSDPALASMLSFELPFTDPLAQLFTDLLPLGF